MCKIGCEIWSKLKEYRDFLLKKLIEIELTQNLVNSVVDTSESIFIAAFAREVLRAIGCYKIPVASETSYPEHTTFPPPQFVDLGALWLLHRPRNCFDNWQVSRLFPGAPRARGVFPGHGHEVHWCRHCPDALSGASNDQPGFLPRLLLAA